MGSLLDHAVRLVSGHFVLIDREDEHLLDEHAWYIVRGYVVRHRGPRDDPHVYLHREILHTPVGFLTDHRNRNPLDNRRSNLRMASESQNAMNGRRRPNKTGYKGVYQNKGRFAAMIRVQQKVIYLGRYDTAEEAARAYDEKARELGGEFAVLNFPSK